MIQLYNILQTVLRIKVLVLTSIFLVSCQVGLPGQGSLGTPVPVAAKLPPADGQIIGTGKIRVAMLLPLTAPGNGGRIGLELSNAARLAMQDFGQNSIQLVIKDTEGQAAKTQGVASQAIREGASIILGPLFSGSVSAASSVTIPANRSLVAFSSDPRRARRGVYLMSFSPQADIERSLRFAISQGNTKFVSLLPVGSYGTLAELTMKEVLSKNGAELLALQKYDRSNLAIETAVTTIAAAANEATVIYIPDGGKVPNAILQALKRAGVKTGTKMILGSGQWESTNLADRNLDRAVYAGRDQRQFARFAERYKSAYGAEPSSTAGLAYDAVSMVSGLARRQIADAFSFANIESRNGYSGVNGIFRFDSTGKADRGLAIYQVQSGKPVVVSPAPTTFGPGS